MLRCSTCLNPQKTPKPKKRALEQELALLQSAEAVLEQKLHANLTRQHLIRKQLAQVLDNTGTG